MLKALIFVLTWISTNSLSSYLTQPYWCDALHLHEIGVDIMNWPTIEDHDNKVKVLRGDNELKDGDTFVYGESLTVTLSNENIVGSRAHQYCFEVSAPGQFEGPKYKVGCDGRRSILNVTTLVMPTLAADADAAPSVQIFCAHSKGYGQVKITSNFTLHAPSSHTIPISDPDL